MNATIALILALAALMTATLSAILGMGGGIMLLAVLLTFMPHGDAIPTHAAVQIASNGTRVLAFFRNVDGDAFGRFCLGVVPGGLIGMGLLWTLGEPDESEPLLKMLVGAFILLATYVPTSRMWARLPTAGRPAWRRWDFPVLGLLAGTAGLTVGAVGPLIAPLFAHRDFGKERLIATKALCQLATHAMKIPAFLLLRDLEVARLGGYALVMIVMVIPGTLLGKRLLKRVSERHFAITYRVALTAAGLKLLVIDGLLEIVG